MGDNTMFDDLSDESNKDMGEDLGVFDQPFNEDENPLEQGYDANYMNDNQENMNYFYQNDGQSNYNPVELDQQNQQMYQSNSMNYQYRNQSYSQQQEIPNNEMKVEVAMDQEEPQNVEIKQEDEHIELNFNHLIKQEDDNDLEQPIRSQPDVKPIEESAITFFQQEFQDIWTQANSATMLQCFPPPYYKNFIYPDSMAPPNLEVIQKNKSFFNLGKKIDFSTVYQKPTEMITKEERQLVSQILTPEKNFYDVMQEVMSSIMNKSVEILKHSVQGGQQLGDYIADMETLVKKFSVLCRISKIKFAKLEVKNIFENEKALFEKSANQIKLSMQQIQKYKDSLKISEILNNRNQL